MSFLPRTFVLVCVGVATLCAQNPDAAPPKPDAAKGQSGRGFGGPIVLGPDDKPFFPDPPAGFDVASPGVKQGRLEMIEYASKTVGARSRNGS